MTPDPAAVPHTDHVTVDAAEQAPERWYRAELTELDTNPSDYDYRTTALQAAATRWSGITGTPRGTYAADVVATAREFETYLRGAYGDVST
jgi:hypothetical protein